MLIVQHQWILDNHFLARYVTDKRSTFLVGSGTLLVIIIVIMMIIHVQSLNIAAFKLLKIISLTKLYKTQMHSYPLSKHPELRPFPNIS